MRHACHFSPVATETTFSGALTQLNFLIYFLHRGHSIKLSLNAHIYPVIYRLSLTTLWHYLVRLSSCLSVSKSALRPKFYNGISRGINGINMNLLFALGCAVGTRTLSRIPLSGRHLIVTPNAPYRGVWDGSGSVYDSIVMGLSRAFQFDNYELDVECSID